MLGYKSPGGRVLSDGGLDITHNEEMAGALEHSTQKFIETAHNVDEMVGSIQNATTRAEKMAHSTESTAQDLDQIGEALDVALRVDRKSDTRERDTQTNAVRQTSSLAFPLPLTYLITRDK